VTKAAALEKAQITPPMAGPTMVAVCQLREFQASARHQAARDQHRGDRAAGRTEEGPARTEDAGDDEDRPQRRPPDGERRKGQGADDIHRQRRAHDRLAVVAVRGLSGDKGETKHRQELDEADHRQDEGRLLHLTSLARQAIDFPANGHRLDLHPDGG
jgi:hypothetical protein